MTKGIIALDIDGTVTDRNHDIPERVQEFLASLAKDGWAILFVTGRSLAFGTQALHVCTFPYHLAFSNGAVICRMPGEEVIDRCDLASESLKLLIQAAESEGLDPFIHTDKGAYFRPRRHLAEDLEYFETRRQKTGEGWTPVEDFAALPRQPLPYAKFFGLREALERLKARLVESGSFSATIILDPLRLGSCVMLVTHARADKGAALARCRDLLAPKGVAIAAGDDYNDEPLFTEADVAIAMGTAPEELKAKADIVAPASCDEGIIAGLAEAIARLGGRA